MTNTAKKMEIQKSEMVLLSQVLEGTGQSKKIGFFKKIISSLKSNSNDDLNFEKWERLESKPRRSSSHYGRWI